MSDIGPTSPEHEPVLAGAAAHPNEASPPHPAAGRVKPGDATCCRVPVDGGHLRGTRHAVPLTTAGSKAPGGLVAVTGTGRPGAVGRRSRCLIGQ